MKIHADNRGLFSSYNLNDLLLKNRVVMSPLTRSRAGTERLANPLMAEYYSQRATAGMIITEATVISKQGIGWLNSPGIYSDEQAESWRQVVDAVHAKVLPSFSSFGTAAGLLTAAFTRVRVCQLPLRPSNSKEMPYIPPVDIRPMKHHAPWKPVNYQLSWRIIARPPNGPKERVSTEWRYTRPMDISLTNFSSPEPIRGTTAMAEI
jgi:hypothetical protein